MTLLYFITGNTGKFKELKEKLKSLDIQVVQKDLGYPEIQVDSLEEVVIFGARFLQKQFPYEFVIEDAGLFIDALNGFPGVYSKHVFYTIGLDGILKLLENILKNERTATFRSVYALHEPNKKLKIFSGACSGQISIEERGTGGFGYDPIFIPSGKTKTFAQMTLQEKNAISHRGNALEQLRKFLGK